MENLRPPFIISIYSKPASSKSHLMYILCHMRAEDKIHILFVFMSTKKNDFYDNMVDTKHVMRYNERLLTQFWKKAEAISHKGKNILLVFDNCIGSVNWKAPIVDEVFSNHRHNNVSILVSMQYPSKLPTLIQEVSWVSCIFKQATFLFISSVPLVDIPFYVFSQITINTLLLFISTGYGPTSPLVKIINLSFNTLLN